VKPIFFWEIKQRRNYLLWWTFSTLALVCMLMAIYPSIHKEAAQLNQVMSQLPESVRNLRGTANDITSPTGYLSGELYYLTLPMLFIVMAIGLGSSLLARDEQAHTLELLLSRPISRGSVLAAKALSGLTMMILVNVVACAAIIIIGAVVKLDLGLFHILIASLYCLLFSTSFGVIAFMLSATSLARHASAGIATLVALGSYLLASFSSLASWVETIAKLLPYHYYDPYHILRGKLSGVLTNYIVVLLFGAVLISYFSFKRRDIE